MGSQEMLPLPSPSQPNPTLQVAAEALQLTLNFRLMLNNFSNVL